LYIATVLHTYCLLTVVSQVPVLNFCEYFMSITSIIMSVCSLRIQLPFQFFHCFFSSISFLLRLQDSSFAASALERIRHDDPAVVFAAPARIRAPLGARWRLELVALVSFHSCHTLRKQIISPKPPTHHHDSYVHVPVIVLSQTVAPG
jgi:hypothetical protein